MTNTPICLNNYIVLRDGCYCVGGAKVATPTPTSGYYIEDLPGLSLENLSDVTPENTTATDMVNNMVYFAAALVEKQVTAYLSGNGFDLNKMGYELNVCSPTSNYSIPVALERGLRISRYGLNSPQARIFIENVRIKSKTAGNTTIYIKDIDGNVLWSKSVTLVADVETYVTVGLHFLPEIIFIVADASTVQLYEYNCMGAVGCCGKEAKANHSLSVMGWDGVQNSYIGYLGVCARLDCTDENIICNWLQRLKLAILYRAGAMLLEEWIAPSSRINFIKNEKDWAAAYVEKWNNLSIEYVKAELKNIENLVKQDKYCYKCEQSFKTIAVLPS